MFALLSLIVSLTGFDSDDRLPEVDLSFSVKKVEIVRDSVLRVKEPKKVVFSDFRQLKDNRKLETPSKDWEPLYFGE